MLGRIEGKKRRGRLDEMVGWYYQLSGHELEQTQGDGDGRRGLACCNSWIHRVQQDLVIEQVLSRSI